MRYLIGILWVLLFSSLHAQSSKEDLIKYCEFLTHQQVDSLMQYFHPKLFEFISKEELTKTLRSVYGDSSMVVSLGSPKKINLKKSFILKGVTYEVLTYQFDMNIMFADTTSEASSFEFIYGLMKAQYGKKRVNKNENKESINVLVDSRNIGILDPNQKNWIFINYKSKKDPILGKLLSDKALRKL